MFSVLCWRKYVMPYVLLHIPQHPSCFTIEVVVPQEVLAINYNNPLQFINCSWGMCSYKVLSITSIHLSQYQFCARQVFYSQIITFFLPLPCRVKSWLEMETEALNSEEVGGGVNGHSRTWKASERRVHREHGPHTKGHAGAPWGRDEPPKERGHAGNQSWQRRHFSSTKGSAVSGPLGYVLTFLSRAASRSSFR